MICDTCKVENCSDREEKVVVIACSAYKRPPTNADRIRAMSDEELEKLLIEFSAFACIFPDKDCEEVSCVECVTNWLHQPAEEE